MVVYILSGIPGVGKSYYAKYLVNSFTGRLAIVSADDFFMVDGKYVYDKTKIKEAHDNCLRSFASLMAKKDVDMIIVDNTNINIYEIAPYYRLAEAFGETVKIIRLFGDPIKCWKRNNHGVPFDTIIKMHQNMMSNSLPSWWKIEIIPMVEKGE